jgi:hypothetical protein
MMQLPEITVREWFGRFGGSAETGSPDVMIFMLCAGDEED